MAKGNEQHVPNVHQIKPWERWIQYFSCLSCNKHMSSLTLYVLLVLVSIQCLPSANLIFDEIYTNIELILFLF